MRVNAIILTGVLAAVGFAHIRPAFSQGMRPQLPQQTARPVPAPSAQVPAGNTDMQSPFFGAVSRGNPSAEELSLSLSDAINQGLRNNLGQILSEQEKRIALGEQRQARSALLPNLSMRVAEEAQQINLAGFGFPGFPGIGTIVGPFSVFDARAFLSQSVFDMRAISNARAGSENLKAADFSYENARDIIVQVIATLYLQAIAGASRIEAAQAQLNTAQALYNQAVSFKEAGVVPAIEVLRAQVELQAMQQQLIFAQNEFEKEKLSLARAIGLPTAQRFRLTDQVPYKEVPAISMEQALDRAYGSRSDYQSALASVRASEYIKKAAEGERLPLVSVDTDYGDLGRTPGTSHGTFSATASLRVPLFEGGRIRGEVLQADALLQQRKAAIEDLRGRIEYEIRTTFLDLKAAGDRVEVARSARELAQQQMTQAQDRFAAGVTGNIEVVQAQEALSTAQENYIASLFAYNVAKTSLARALGGAEKNFRQFLLGETQ